VKRVPRDLRTAQTVREILREDLLAGYTRLGGGRMLSSLTCRPSVAAWCSIARAWRRCSRR
jgi:hypothetical protein